ncbi:DUF397 domain-containing protein [Saccharothrix sp. NPDC042600]|uniref:DUF397 domain-containing protein n=1 Tax=Saccharothrix TaxID=2071 RepID=UPI0034028D8C|nr:hypothetical protein GCM10017745_67630 [Saccharothrix mutabilis subsp. capreolus]
MDEPTTPLDTEFTGWRKSSHSQPTSNGDCVLIGRSRTMIGVRDSKCPHPTVLAFSGPSWRAFLDGAIAKP